MRTASCIAMILLCGCASTSPESQSRSGLQGTSDRIAAPVDRVWIELENVYRGLGIPVEQVQPENWSIQSGNVVPYQTRIFGIESPAYVRCGAALQAGPSRAQETYVTVTTTLVPDGAAAMVRSHVAASQMGIDASGKVVRRECISLGVLEERILRSLQRRV